MTQSNKQRTAGWIITGLVGAFLLFSASGKFMDWEGKEAMFAKLGLTTQLVRQIGVLEIILVLLYLVPRTSFLAAILFTGYLGGAVFTHLRVGEPIYFPIILGVILWLGLALRKPDIFRLAKGD